MADFFKLATLFSRQNATIPKTKKNKFVRISSMLSPPQTLLFFKKPRKRGKGGKKGKGGKTGKAEKAREKGKSEESLCQISVEIWQKLSISDRTKPECRLSFS